MPCAFTITWQSGGGVNMVNYTPALSTSGRRDAATCAYISLTSRDLTKCQGDREVQSHHVAESGRQIEVFH